MKFYCNVILDAQVFLLNIIINIVKLDYYWFNSSSFYNIKNEKY